jgi:tryptophan synthase alpha chain
MGKERIKKLFQNNSQKDILSIYITAGYPKLEAMPGLIETLAKAGVDFIEAGMPYSDPLADGKTIQYSSSRALQNGINLDTYFTQIKSVRTQVDIPVFFMGYFNQVLRYGINRFLSACENSGIDGLILPDLPPEIYQRDYQKTFEKYDLGLSFLISPTTSHKRIDLIDRLSSAFIYVVSDSSTTGKTGDFSKEQIAYFERINKLKTRNPKIIGFGIDSPEKYRLANRYTDGAIIGSAFIKAVKNEKNYQRQASDFIRFIKNT